MSKLKSLFCLYLGLLTLAACSSSGVKGEAPFVQVMSWEIQGSELSASLRIRNVNDQELAIETLNLNVTLQQQELTSYRGSHSLTIPAGGFDSLDLSMTATEQGVELLQRLQQGEQSSLPYVLQGSVRAEGPGELFFSRDGHLYTVPGRPGQFR